MNQVNYNTEKNKYKHLSYDSIRGMIREYNEFMTSVRAEFRATHKNRRLKVPKRNINKTEFINELSVKYCTSVSNVYKIIKESTVTILDSNLKERIIYDPEAAIAIREKNKHIPNNTKLNKAKEFIDMVVKEVKDSKFNSIDETINDLKINRNDEIEGLVTVSTSTIYNYVKKGKIALKPIDLPRMLRRREKNYKTYTPKRQRGTSIDERPDYINDRSEFGHWEGDLVTGPRDGQNGAFLTLAERKENFFYMIPIKNKKSKSVYMAINKLAKKYGEDFSKIFKSITFDNGAEFARFKDIEKRHGIKTYFAHPYASYERGTNEVTNQLIRYYIKKGTDINTVDKDLIKFIQKGINNKKRKKLGYKSAESLFLNRVKSITNNTITDVYL